MVTQDTLPARRQERSSLPVGRAEHIPEDTPPPTSERTLDERLRRSQLRPRGHAQAGGGARRVRVRRHAPGPRAHRRHDRGPDRRRRNPEVGVRPAAGACCRFRREVPAGEGGHQRGAGARRPRDPPGRRRRGARRPRAPGDPGDGGRQGLLHRQDPADHVRAARRRPRGHRPHRQEVRRVLLGAHPRGSRRAGRPADRPRRHRPRDPGDGHGPAPPR